MKNWSLKKLVNVAAEICDYALGHYDTSECHRPKTPWPDDSPNHSLAWSALGASSCVLSCIAAQHTPGGRNGVETEAPFYALRMWEFMPLKKRRRLAEAFFKELGAQKKCAKKPHQPLVASCTPVPPHAPPAAPKPCGVEYVATDPKGLLNNIKIIESACPRCLGPMEFEVGVSIRTDTNPEVVSVDADGCRGTGSWWCPRCEEHLDPLQFDALAEARAAAEAKRETCETVTPEDLQRAVVEITETYALWTRGAAGYGSDEAPRLRRSMERAMSHRMSLAFCDRRTRPRVGDKVTTLKGDNDCDENNQPRRALPGAVGKVTYVDDDRFHVVFDESEVWVILELYEICDPTQYTWEP